MPRTAGGPAWALLLMLAMPCASIEAAGGDDTFSHVRSTNAFIREVLSEGSATSPTLRALLSAVDHSDLIIYISTEQLPFQVDGGINFVQAAAGFRYLRITVRPGLSRVDLAAVLGHELQHAIEIAQAPEVRDAQSMEAFYRKVGFCLGGGFQDTDAARQAGKQVRTEVLNGPSPAELR